MGEYKSISGKETEYVKGWGRKEFGLFDVLKGSQLGWGVAV